MFKILSVVPVAGKTSRKTSALLFVRYLSMMLSVNTPFKEAVICASKVLKNEFYAKKLVQMAEKIKNISELKEAIRSTGIFPKFFLQMIAVGEKSQSIESVLLSLPDIYEKEVDKSIFEFRSFLTGFTMILLGIIVGFIVVALYLPIFMMAGVVGG
jgi:type IV pilus assembly protein PilC